MDLFFSIIVVSMQFADSNRGSLVTEVTAPPLPYCFYFTIRIIKAVVSNVVVVVLLTRLSNLDVAIVVKQGG